jgi:hypothetical protein
LKKFYATNLFIKKENKTHKKKKAAVFSLEEIDKFLVGAEESGSNTLAKVLHHISKPLFVVSP